MNGTKYYEEKFGDESARLFYFGVDVACNYNTKHNASITNFNPTYPCICKLHGDFRYGKLQNTSEELREIEYKLQG